MPTRFFSIITLLLIASGCVTTPEPVLPTHEALVADCRAQLQGALTEMKMAPPDIRAALLKEAIGSCEQVIPGITEFMETLTEPVTITVDLPPKPNPPEPTPTAVVSVSSAGALAIGGQEVEGDPASLKQAILTELGVDALGDVNVGIAADSDVPYTQIVELMDTLQQVGVNNIVLVVESE